MTTTVLPATTPQELEQWEWVPRCQVAHRYTIMWSDTSTTKFTFTLPTCRRQAQWLAIMPCGHHMFCCTKHRNTTTTRHRYRCITCGAEHHDNNIGWLWRAM